jgi:orotidine-5'-phosphate decarboxylase
MRFSISPRVVLKIVAPHVPIVKFQSAFFEKYLWEGVEAYYSLIQEAKELGLLVIGDVKRGDIGSTASAYAAGHLAEQTGGSDGIATPDAITVNPMLGLDTLEPFMKTAKEGKGLFVLVRTSNPGSAELQDAKLATGQTWSEMLAEKLGAACRRAGAGGIARLQQSRRGGRRDANAHHAEPAPAAAEIDLSASRLRRAGCDGRDDPCGFHRRPGAIVSASRSILYAHQDAKNILRNSARTTGRNASRRRSWT